MNIPEKSGFPPQPQPQPQPQLQPGFTPAVTTAEPPPAYGQFPSAGVGQPPQYGQTVGYSQPLGVGQSTATNVVVTQPANFPGHRGFRPPDNLVLAIIAIFFCWPMAICAIMYSVNSRSAADCGNLAKAESDGRTARNIGIAAIVVGLVIIVIAVVLNVVVTASLTSYYCYGYDC